MSFDLIIKNGTIVTAETSYQADIGIQVENGEFKGEAGRGKFVEPRLV